MSPSIVLLTLLWLLGAAVAWAFLRRHPGPFVLVLACLALVACGRREDPPPAATSSLTEAQALSIAGGVSQAFAPPLSFTTPQPTGSMRPAIDERSVVLLEPYAGQDLRVGDIVEFRRDGRQILHRVREVRPGGVITQGDANPFPDDFVPLSAISRRYVGQIVFY